MTVLQKYNQATGQWEILQAGVAGATGPANKLTIGTVTTVTNATPASATITGTQPNQVLNLTLPKGDVGGWVTAALLADGTDLNTVTTPGTYRIANGGTLALNHPGDGLSGALEVVAASATRVLQRFTSQTNNLVAIRNLVGYSTWSPWVTVPLKGSIGSGDHTGTGSPNGVVTASPGTYYTDTAGTSGAWRWLKTSGTGNTGWAVVFGDTGWRDCSSWLYSANWTPSTLGAQFRRIGDVVLMRLRILPTAARYQTSSTFWIDLLNGISDGFRPSAPFVADEWTAASVCHSANGPVISVRRVGNTKLSLSCSVNVSLSATTTIYTAEPVQWVTPDPWPTTLPGTPA